MTKHPKRPKGLREVAERAGVCIATVSRVAARSPHISPGTQKRVRDAARSLGIDLARKNKPKVLAFILSNREVLHPFHSRILVGAESACAARGWDMLFLMFRYQPNVPGTELHLPAPVQRRDMVTGLVLAGTNYPNLLECLKHRDIPFVTLGNNVLAEAGQWEFDAVFSDDIQGALDMTRYLQNLGHSDIWFVGNTAEPWTRRCLQGYERAMDEKGMIRHVSSLESSNADEVGYLGTKLIFGRGENATAILGATDQAARGIYKAAADLGLRIPEDVSVAGCNDTLTQFLNPALSTVREFPEQLGKQMVDLLLSRIDDPDRAPQRVTIPTELVKNDSCRELRTSERRDVKRTLVEAAT